MIVWKIALRNLREHKTKTIIVGILISVAMTILVAGNSLMDSISTKMEANYRETYTGDAVVHAKSIYQISLFGVEGLDRLNAAVPIIPDFGTVAEALDSSAAVAWTGIVQTQGMYLHDEEAAGFSTLWGVNPEGYLGMFDGGIEVIAGAAFEPNERGLLINEAVARQILEDTGVRYGPGDTIKISSNSQSGGNRIREAPISGVFRFNQQNPQLATVSLIDLATARELSGLDVEKVDVADLSEEEQSMLGDVTEDGLFGDDLFGGDLVAESSDGAEGAPSASIDINDIFGDTPIDERRASMFGVDKYHFVIANAATSRSAGRLVRTLNRSIEKNTDATVDDWQWAAGATVTLVVAVQIIFNAVALIISIVSIIIIVNTLVISISERIPELGTIRAIGGKKRFVRKLITRETLLITGAFGFIGMLAGAAIVAFIAFLGLEANNQFLQLLFGGDVFRPGLSITAIVSSLIGVGLMTWIASLYPVRMATSINPVVAMQRG